MEDCFDYHPPADIYMGREEILVPAGRSGKSHWLQHTTNSVQVDMHKTKGCLFLFIVPLLLAAKPVDPNELNRQGVAANARGDYKKAVTFFRQALALEPGQTTLRYNLFHALNNFSIQSASQEQADQAIAACSEALRLVPEDVRVASNLAIFFHNRAVDLMQKGDFGHARDSIQNAQKVVDQFGLGTLSASIRETYARTYLLEGRQKFRHNEVAEALGLYDRCIQIDPDDPLAYFDRSRIYYEQDFFQDAIADLELAAEIQGDKPQILSLIQRLKIEAEKKGLPLSDQDAFFVLEAPGATPSQEQGIKRILKDLRLKVARVLTLNPKTPMVVAVRWEEPFVSLKNWISTPGNRVESERLTIPLNGADLAGEEFLKMSQFQYVTALIQNCGGSSVPYWFAIGLAQYLAEGSQRLTTEETHQLQVAGENFLLFRVDDLTLPKIIHLEDSKQVYLAYAESKALVVQLIETVRMNGLRQIIRSLVGGIPFEQALKDNANISAVDIETEWRASLGLPPP